MIFCFNAAEVFQIATELKENCIAFYLRARDFTKDPEVNDLFADLAREEAEHGRKIEAMKGQLPWDAKIPTVNDPQNELDLYIKMMADQHMLSSLEGLEAQLAEIKETKDALKVALELEKDSVIFFLGMQEATCEGKDRDLITLLIREEQDHVRRLSLQLRRMLLH